MLDELPSHPNTGNAGTTGFVLNDVTDFSVFHGQPALDMELKSVTWQELQRSNG